MNRLIAILAMLTLPISFAYSADLMDVYRQALASDPTFKSSEALWLATKQNLPISESEMLLHVDLTGAVQSAYTEIKSASFLANNINYDHTLKNYGVNLSQNIFNYAAWSGIKNARAQVKQAAANFNSAAQDLMLRAATAYFNVLQANDDLRYTRAEKKSVKQQLDQTKDRFEVGLVPITDVDEARAKYKTVVANEISAKNALENRLEELREITNHLYKNVSGVNGVPLVTPKPYDMHQWVHVALKQNYDIQAAHFGTLASKENISVQNLGNWPIMSATGGYRNNEDTNQAGTGAIRSDFFSVGVSVDFPILQGGAVNARTRQASYQYAQASAEEEKTMRSVIADARKAYLGVLASISQIRAQKQAIIAARSSLKSNQAAYAEGTRDILDVLDAQTILFDSQRNYAKSQYEYLIKTLELKKAAGTLSVDDLRKINHWLHKRINLRQYYTDLRYIGRNRLVKQLPKPPVLLRNNYHYRLQLFESKSLEQAKRFVSVHGLHGDVDIFRVGHWRHKNYIVLWGRYLSADSARAALSALPVEIARLHPWVRSMRTSKGVFDL